jgi:hypothetical protein
VKYLDICVGETYAGKWPPGAKRKVLELCPNQQMGTQVYYELVHANPIHGERRKPGTRAYCSLKRFAQWANHQVKEEEKRRRGDRTHRDL